MVRRQSATVGRTAVVRIASARCSNVKWIPDANG